MITTHQSFSFQVFDKYSFPPKRVGIVSTNINKAEKSFDLHVTSCIAIRDTSSALEFMKVWRQKEIPTQTHS